MVNLRNERRQQSSLKHSAGGYWFNRVPQFLLTPPSPHPLSAVTCLPLVSADSSPTSGSPGLTIPTFLTSTRTSHTSPLTLLLWVWFPVPTAADRRFSHCKYTTASTDCSASESPEADTPRNNMSGTDDGATSEVTLTTCLTACPTFSGKAAEQLFPVCVHYPLCGDV